MSARVLAIDTSTWWGGIALVERDGDRVDVVAEAAGRVHASHAAKLLPRIEHLLDDADWPRESLDAFAATRGPGSFTGLRIGLGTARGLALAAGRPCLGIGTLDAMAAAHGDDDRARVPLLDAGRGEVYGARFEAAGFPPVGAAAPWVGPVDALAGSHEPCVAFGPGADAHRGALAEIRSVVVRAAPRSIAAAAGRLAAMRLAAGADDGEGCSPLYVRPPDAIARPRK